MVQWSKKYRIHMKYMPHHRQSNFGSICPARTLRRPSPSPEPAMRPACSRLATPYTRPWHALGTSCARAAHALSVYALRTPGACPAHALPRPCASPAPALKKQDVTECGGTGRSGAGREGRDGRTDGRDENRAARYTIGWDGTGWGGVGCGWNVRAGSNRATYDVMGRDGTDGTKRVQDAADLEDGPCRDETGRDWTDGTYWEGRDGSDGRLDGRAIG